VSNAPTLVSHIVLVSVAARTLVLDIQVLVSLSRSLRHIGEAFRVHAHVQYLPAHKDEGPDRNLSLAIRRAVDWNAFSRIETICYFPSSMFQKSSE
jgi:hypothetical protein